MEKIKNEKKNDELSFENAMKELQDVVRKLESGTLSLEESLQTFEKGVGLIRFCQENLAQAEIKVEQLVRISEEGKVNTEPFKT